MGTDNIPARSGGQTITAQFFNLLRSVLGGDLVPRNASGVPTDLAGAIGTSTYRMLSAFAQKYNLGAPASGLSIEEDSGAIIFKVGGVEKGRIDSNGIKRNSLDTLNYSLSSSCGTFSTTSTSFVSVTNLSRSITTNGNPVEIFLVPDNSATNLAALGPIGSSSTQAAMQLRITRDGTQIFSENIIADAFGSSTTSFTLGLPPSAIRAIDFPSAGTYTYAIQIKGSAGGSANLNHCQLLVRELK